MRRINKVPEKTAEDKLFWLVGPLGWSGSTLRSSRRISQPRVFPEPEEQLGSAPVAFIDSPGPFLCVQ